MAKRSNNEPTKAEVQTTKLNKLPLLEEHDEEFAEELARDAKAAFSEKGTSNEE
ncbi:hypothetical protein D3C81_1729240 [compost metagenome]